MKIEKTLSFSDVWKTGFYSLRTDYIPTLKTAFVFCIFLGILQFFLSYGLRVMNPETQSEQTMLTHRIIELVWSLVASIFINIAILYSLYFSRGYFKNIGLISFIKKNVKLVTIETFRTIFIVLLYTLLLIIPGLIKVIQLIFVPFIVQLHKSYQMGKVDALEKSKELVKGSFLGIATLFIVFQVFTFFIGYTLPAQIQKWLGLSSSSLEYLSLEFVFVVVFGVFVEIAFFVMLISIFEKIVVLKEGQNELAF